MNGPMNLNPVAVVGVGKSLPETVITNNDLSKIINVDDEWISNRTGIKERRVVKGEETSKKLAINAAKDALDYAGLHPAEINLIITASSLSDNLSPSTACEVQGGLRATNSVAFDLHAACSGFIYGLNVARNFIMNGTYDVVLLIGADLHSRFINWKDKSTCTLFGDGAGAVVLKKSIDEINDILAIDMHSDGTKADTMRIPLYGKNCPLVEPNIGKKQQLNMNGLMAAQFAIKKVPESITQAADLAGLTLDEIDYFIPHQTNMRIIYYIYEKLGIPQEKIIVNMDKYANTSSASIPICLDEAIKEKKIKIPSTIAVSGFGAGLTWGTAIIRWRSIDKQLRF